MAIIECVCHVMCNVCDGHTYNVIVIFISSGIFFQVYDPNNNRYEVPIVTPKVETEATSLDYSVTVTNFPFGIAVTRKSSGTVV